MRGGTHDTIIASKTSGLTEPCRKVLFPSLLVLLLLLAGMMLLRRPRSNTSFVSSSPPKVGSLAPDFTLSDYNGKTCRLSALRGSKVCCISSVLALAVWSGGSSQVATLPAPQVKGGLRISLVKILSGKKVKEEEKTVRLRGDSEWLLVFLCERLDKSPISSWRPKYAVEKPEGVRPFGAGGGPDQPYTRRLFPKPLAPHQMAYSVHISAPVKQVTVRLSFERWEIKKRGIVEFSGIPVPPEGQVVAVGKQAVTKEGITVRVEKVGYVDRPEKALAVVLTQKSPKADYHAVIHPSDWGRAVDDRGHSLKVLRAGDWHDLDKAEPSFFAGAAVQFRIEPPHAAAKTLRLIYPVYEEVPTGRSPVFEFKNVTLAVSK